MTPQQFSIWNAPTRVVRSGCLVLLLLAGAAAAGSDDYAVGRGDVLSVTVGDEDKLSGEFKVSDEGLIVYPLLGALRVSALTVTEIAKDIRDRLGADYIVSPQVAVYVKEYNSKKVAVLGDITTPGFFTLKQDSSLLAVLSEAGVPLSNGDMTIMITHADSAPTNGPDASPQLPTIVSMEKLLNPWQGEAAVMAQDGDRIFVRSGGRGKVIVSGKVKTSGVVPFSEGLTVLEAINKAGGLAEFANPKAIRVVRETATGSEVRDVDLSAVMQGDRSRDIALEDGDIIIVPRRWF